MARGCREALAYAQAAYDRAVADRVPFDGVTALRCLMVLYTASAHFTHALALLHEAAEGGLLLAPSPQLGEHLLAHLDASPRLTSHLAQAEAEAALQLFSSFVDQRGDDRWWVQTSSGAADGASPLLHPHEAHNGRLRQLDALLGVGSRHRGDADAAGAYAAIGVADGESGVAGAPAGAGGGVRGAQGQWQQWKAWQQQRGGRHQRGRSDSPSADRAADQSAAWENAALLKRLAVIVTPDATAPSADVDTGSAEGEREGRSAPQRTLQVLAAAAARRSASTWSSAA